MKFTLQIVGAISVACVFALTGCEKKEAAPPGGAMDKLKQAATDAVNQAGAEVSRKVEEGFAALRDQAAAAAEKTLNEAKPKIEALKARASEASAEVKPAMDSAVKAIDEQYEKVKAKIPELKAATSDTWKGISESLAKEGKSLMDQIKSAMEKFGVK